MRAQAEAVRLRAELPGALQAFLAFEQCNLYKVETYRAGAAGDPFDCRYLPEARAIFSLPCFWVKRKHLYVYGRGQDNGHIGCSLSNDKSGEADVLLPIHPVEVEQHAKFLRQARARNALEGGLCLLASPTSSTRTLLVWQEGRPENAFFAKLSLSGRSFGDRRLSRRKIAGSVGLSGLVHQIRSELPTGLRYFPESLGVVPRSLLGCGALFRSIPQEILQNRVTVAPLFSLMGGSVEHRPLLMEWMEALGVSAQEMVETILLDKFACLWADLVFDQGLILEAHGQDLLLVLGPDVYPEGAMYYRDFEGLAVDWALRRARGLADPEALPNEYQWFLTYETWDYPLYQLISTKLRTSLFDYVHLVLRPLEMALAEWHAKGIVGGKKVRQGDLSFSFSQKLRRAIQEKWGMREREEYDIALELNRFVKFLLDVRSEIVNGCHGIASF